MASHHACETPSWADVSLTHEHRNMFFFGFYRSPGRDELSVKPIVILSVFLLMRSIGAFAQAPDSVVLKDVVIQATRTNAYSPVPHNNFTPKDLKRTYQSQDVPYLLSSVPSLVESSDAGVGTGYTSMRIRGSDPTRINVTINGVPFNDAESQQVYWVNMPDLVSSAAEIQVQRGVGGSTNGAGAFGATVNLDLSHIESQPSAVISNSIGSFDTRRHSAQVHTGLLRGKTAFSGRISQLHSDGYIDRASADLNAFHVSGAYIDDKQSLQGHILSGHEITYQAWNGVPAQYLRNPALRSYNSAGAEKPGEPYDNEVDNYTQRHFLLHYKRRFMYGLDLQLNGHYTRGFGYYEQYKAGQSFASHLLPPLDSLAATDLVRQRWLDNHFYGGVFALRWNPAVNPPFLKQTPEFMLGGGLNRYQGSHFGEVIWASYATAPKGHRYYDNDAVKTDGNIFLKGEMRFVGGLGGLFDLQYRRVAYQFLGFNQERENVTQDALLHFFNPKAGLTYALPRHWLAYAYIGIAHREPNRDDYTQSTPASRPRSERLRDLEAGIRRIQSDWWSFNANVYWMQYRNQLVLDGRINDVGAYIRTNVPDSYRAGIELEIAVAPYERFRAKGNLALSRNKVRRFVEYRDNWDSGEQTVFEYRNTNLAYSPSVISRGEISWDAVRRADKALTLSLVGKYVGKQYLDNTSNENTTLDAYFTADFRVNYEAGKLLGGHLSLIGSLNNLFDARYAPNGWTYRFSSASYDPRPDDPYAQSEGGGIYNLSGYFPQAGRNWSVSARWQF